MGTRSLSQQDTAKEPLPMTGEGKRQESWGIPFICEGDIATQGVNYHRRIHSPAC
jgi:hypothetical protein